jgi:carboxylate-amine ligase
MTEDQKTEKRKQEKSALIAKEKAKAVEGPSLLQGLRRVANILPWNRGNAEVRKAVEEIIFKPNGFLTLGVEIEVNLLDPNTCQLQNRGDEVLKAAEKLKKVKPEFCLDTVEINTGICHDVHDVKKDLTETIQSLSAIAGEFNLALMTTGRHPTADHKDSKLYDDARYRANLERIRWLLKRSIILGLHVHMGMRNHHECIRYNNFFLHFLPHLLALSSSSPFWQGEDTGLYSSRPTAYEAIPTSGQPYPLSSWEEFEELYWSMRNAGAIGSLKDLWWDVRPSPKYGTLEIRVCDGVATLAETLAITTFIQLLGHWFSDHLSWLDQMPRPRHWVRRENKWRAMRYGLGADLVISADGKTKPLTQDILDWLEKLQPYIDRFGYHEYIDTLRQIISRGTSTDRQRAIYMATQNFDEVVRFNLREFKAGKPLWDEVERSRIDTKQSEEKSLPPPKEARSA